MAGYVETLPKKRDGGGSGKGGTTGPMSRREAKAMQGFIAHMKELHPDGPPDPKRAAILKNLRRSQRHGRRV